MNISKFYSAHMFLRIKPKKNTNNKNLSLANSAQNKYSYFLLIQIILHLTSCTCNYYDIKIKQLSIIPKYSDLKLSNLKNELELQLIINFNAATAISCAFYFYC